VRGTWSQMRQLDAPLHMSAMHLLAPAWADREHVDPPAPHAVIMCCHEASGSVEQRLRGAAAGPTGCTRQLCMLCSAAPHALLCCTTAMVLLLMSG
jgi:hypothetical protein